MEPLALLAQQDDDAFGGGGGAQGAARSGEGLDTGIHASVAERAAAARAVMVARDREDKAQLRDLRKAQRQEKRVR